MIGSIAYPIVDTLFSSGFFVLILKGEHHGQFCVYFTYSPICVYSTPTKSCTSAILHAPNLLVNVQLVWTYNFRALVFTFTFSSSIWLLCCAAAETVLNSHSVFLDCCGD